MKYAIGANGDDSLLEKYVDFNRIHDNQIIEVFGTAPVSLIGSSREPIRLADSPREKIHAHLRKAKERGFKADYLFNSCVNPLSNDEDACQEVSRVIEGVDPDIVTVGNEYLLRLLHKNFPDLPVNVSIVMGISSAKEVKYLLDEYGIQRITLQQDTNRNWDELGRTIKVAKRFGVETELLANELCLYGCPVMQQHYVTLSKAAQVGGKDNAEFEDYCNNRRASNPLDFINAPWIRPEDVRIYEELGVDILKFAGRDKPSNYLLRVAEAFMRGKHKGNIMDLFSETWWPERKKPEVDNRHLDGLLEHMKSKGITHFETIEDVPMKHRINY